MIRKPIIMLFVLTVLCLLSTSAFAENAEWKNSSYDFKNMEKIYIEPEITYGEDVNISDLDLLKIKEAVEENKKQTKKYRFVNSKETADAIVTITTSKWEKIRTGTNPKHILNTKQ